MKAFEFASPTTKEDVVKLLTDPSVPAAVLAGGTDLLGLMKDDVVTARRLVNIKGIAELGGIQYDSSRGLRLGTLVTLHEVISDHNIRREYAGLWQAAEGVRSPQIQNMGTVGGDLCQRPSCWYFRKGYGLLALHQGKSMVKNGDNRYHAILGNSGDACFVNPSNLAPALIALGASVKVFGPEGERTIPVQDLFRTPKATGEQELTLMPGELLTEIVVPPPGGRKSATYEVREREALDRPLVAASVTLEMDGSKVKGAKIALGQVAPTPWPSPRAAESLVGKTITVESADEAGRLAVDGAVALSMNRYKIKLAHVAVKRAILRAAGLEVS